MGTAAAQARQDAQVGSALSQRARRASGPLGTWRRSGGGTCATPPDCTTTARCQRAVTSAGGAGS